MWARGKSMACGFPSFASLSIFGPPGSGKSHLAAACDTLRENCVVGITANRDYLLDTVHRSVGLVTALNPYIGYAAATEVATEAHQSGGSVYDIVLRRGLLTREQLDTVLQPAALTSPRWLTL